MQNVTGDDRTLAVYQSLWAMQPARRDGIVQPIEHCIDLVAEAGFDGVGIDLWATDQAGARAMYKQLERLGLGIVVTAFPKRVADMRDLLVLARDLDVDFLNIIGQVMPVDVGAAVPVVRRWIDMAEEAGVALQIETHRNSLTNDMFAMLRLLDDVPDMDVCADLSHYVVGREFDFPVDGVTEGHIARILARSGSFQGRIATRQQIQVPFRFPQYRGWHAVFLRWWEAGFRSWRARTAVGTNARLHFMCELGPPDYAMTDETGRELSDRFDEALELRSDVKALWARLEDEP